MTDDPRGARKIREYWFHWIVVPETEFHEEDPETATYISLISSNNGRIYGESKV